MPDLILASTSPYRRDLLARLGLPFTAARPACDEEGLKDPALAPQALAELLAEAKARSLARPGAVVIGSDQVCEHAGAILHKPGTAERAQQQLARLAGGTHRLITAVCVVHDGGIERHTDITTLRMRPLSADAIARYVAADAPLDCAGAYKLERLGISLFDDIDSADHTAIVGLPLLALCGLLRRAGCALP